MIVEPEHNDEVLLSTMKGFKMNMPGFRAESSLGPTRGIYRGSIASGGSDALRASGRPVLTGTIWPALLDAAHSPGAFPHDPATAAGDAVHDRLLGLR